MGCGFTDQFGNVLIRPEYLAVGGFYNGRAVVKSNYNQMWDSLILKVTG